MTDNKAPELSVKIHQDDLVTVLARMNSIVEKRNTIPILSYAKMQVLNGDVLFTATDLDIEIQDSVGATESDMEGEITVPALTLYDIARKLPKGSEISLVTRDSRLEITAGRSNFNLPILPSGDFPIMNASDYATEFTLPCDTFKDMIDRTKFAISTEETRYYLNGIYMHANDGMLRAVSTDGHRLALSEIKAPEGVESLEGVIIPRKAILEVRRIMDGFAKDEDIAIKVSNTKIQFTIGNMVMVSKLIDGTFPDYERVIPRANAKKMTVDGRLFSKAVDRVATIAEGRTRSIAFDISQDNVLIRTTGSDYGTGQEEMTAEYSDDKITIGFNAKYLADTMAQVESDKVEFYLDSAAAPALVRDPDSPGSLFVLMPLRV